MKKIKDIEIDIKDENERNLFYNLRHEINKAIEQHMPLYDQKIEQLNNQLTSLSMTCENLNSQMQNLLENVIPNLQSGSGGQWQTLYDKDDENLNLGYPNGVTSSNRSVLEDNLPDLGAFKELRIAYSIQGNLVYALYDITEIFEGGYDFRCINFLTADDLGQTIYCITGLFHIKNGVKKFQFNRVTSTKFVNSKYPTWTLESTLSKNFVFRVQAR